MYQPPFTVTPKIIDLISRISEKIGEINSLESDRQHINLRKENRIRTIHSSLAIENNSLSIEEIIENQSKVTVKVTQKVTVNQKKILDAIKENPHITQTELSEKIGIARKNIISNMKKMQDAGILVRHGADKNGWWEVIEQ